MHGDLLDLDVSRGLVGEQRDEFVGQAAEHRGLGVDIAERGELMSDERMIGDQRLHGR